MKNFAFVLILLMSASAHAWHAAIGTYKMLDKTQTQSGGDASNAFSPMVGVGGNFSLPWSGWGFSPQLGYVRHTVKSDDSYGGEYQIQTIMMLYDFVWVPEIFSGSSVPFAVRLGLGNFRRSTKGKGGTVTIPNGGGTTTAPRPSSSEASYTGTFNLGADFTFGALASWMTNTGLRFETFTFSPLNKEKRTYAFNLMALAYF
jgi:hypothetical protein